MRKSIFISAVAILFICIESHAQSMTYNHDASKQGQIQVMELGAGNLTPELYYTVTHRRYKNGAKFDSRALLYRYPSEVQERSQSCHFC